MLYDLTVDTVSHGAVTIIPHGIIKTSRNVRDASLVSNHGSNDPSRICGTQMRCFASQSRRAIYTLGHIVIDDMERMGLPPKGVM